MAKAKFTLNDDFDCVIAKQWIAKKLENFYFPCSDAEEDYDSKNQLAIVYDANRNNKQNALYLFDVKMDNHPDGASLSLHGILKASDTPTSYDTYQDRGVFKNNFVHYFYNGSLYSENWNSDNLIVK